MESEDLKRWFDPITAICLVLITFLSAFSLELTHWTEHLNRITASALLGVVFGILTGYSSFPKKSSIILLAFFSIGLFLWQIVFSINMQPFWMDRLVDYLLRFRITIQYLLENSPVEDGILFLSLFAIIMTWLSVSIGFNFVRNRKGWGKLLVLLIIFILTNFYLPNFRRNAFLVLINIGSVFLLMGRQYYLEKHEEWQKRGVQEERNFSTLSIRILLLTIFGISCLSFAGNYIISNYFLTNDANQSEYWNRYSSSWELIQNFLFPLSREVGFGEGYFPQELPLGENRSLKEDPVFKVRIPMEYQDDEPFYWQGRIYQYYENGNWSNPDAKFTYISRAPINPKISSGIINSEFIFTYLYPRELIFTPSEYTGVDRATQYFYFPMAEGFQDLISVSDYSIIKRGDVIRVEGGFSSPDETELNAVKENYPAQISERYLSLPKNLDQGIESLAREITKDKQTNFEKALAITNFLRLNFTYSDEVDIPEGIDPISWFLFSDNKGFCNYYASANVLLLRAIDIPARVVIGYSQGDLIPEDASYEVTIADNHAWVEVYFSNIGWVIFEPTPSRPPISYRQEEFPLETTLSREERFLLNEGESSLDLDELEKFQNIAEKYAREVVVEPEEKDFYWIFITLGFASAFLVFGAIIGNLIIVSKKKSLFSTIIYRLSKSIGMENVGWLEKKNNYEQLSPEEKIFSKLKRFSRLIISQPEENQTPKEFMDQLHNELDGPISDLMKFGEVYHSTVFGNSKNEDFDILYPLYRKLLDHILKEKIRRVLGSVQSLFAGDAV